MASYNNFLELTASLSSSQSASSQETIYFNLRDASSGKLYNSPLTPSLYSLEHHPNTGWVISNSNDKWLFVQIESVSNKQFPSTSDDWMPMGDGAVHYSSLLNKSGDYDKLPELLKAELLAEQHRYNEAVTHLFTASRQIVPPSDMYSQLQYNRAYYEFASGNENSAYKVLYTLHPALATPMTDDLKSFLELLMSLPSAITDAPDVDSDGGDDNRQLLAGSPVSNKHFFPHARHYPELYVDAERGAKR